MVMRAAAWHPAWPVETLDNARRAYCQSKSNDVPSAKSWQSLGMTAQRQPSQGPSASLYPAPRPAAHSRQGTGQLCYLESLAKKRQGTPRNLAHPLLAATAMERVQGSNGPRNIGMSWFPLCKTSFLKAASRKTARPVKPDSSSIPPSWPVTTRSCQSLVDRNNSLQILHTSLTRLCFRRLRLI